MKIKMVALGIIFAVVISGVAVADGIIVLFEPHQTGVYKGPGVPISKDYSFTVGTNDSYYAIPIFVNSTNYYWINGTVNAADIGNAGDTGNGQIVGFMNLSDYNNFTVNKSINLLASGYDYHYHGNGVNTYYAIYLNDLNVPSDYLSVIISVTVQGT